MVIKFKNFLEDDNITFVELGYHKFMLYTYNVDKINTLILFSILMFDEPLYFDIDCDHNFWQDWVKFFNKTTGYKKKIYFTENSINISIFYNKRKGKRLFYSGGKDSTMSKLLLINRNEEFKLLQYIVQVYRPFLKVYSEKMSTNFDDILYHNKKSIRKWMKLELYLPIISKYRINYIGIEKELWDDSSISFYYNMNEYNKLFTKYGLEYDSPIKHFYSNEVLKKLKATNSDFIKCDSTDTGKENEFCLMCPKCLINYCLGCNLEEHNFDRGKFRKIRLDKNRPFDTLDNYLKWYVSNMLKDKILNDEDEAINFYNFHKNLANKFGVIV